LNLEQISFQRLVDYLDNKVMIDLNILFESYFMSISILKYIGIINDTIDERVNELSDSTFGRGRTFSEWCEVGSG